MSLRTMNSLNHTPYLSFCENIYMLIYKYRSFLSIHSIKIIHLYGYIFSLLIKISAKLAKYINILDDIDVNDISLFRVLFKIDRIPSFNLYATFLNRFVYQRTLFCPYLLKLLSIVITLHFFSSLFFQITQFCAFLLIFILSSTRENKIYFSGCVHGVIF